MKKLVIVVVAIGAALTLAACGSTRLTANDNAQTSQQAGTKGNVTWILSDCSGSFRRYAPEYVPEMLEVAHRVAARQGRLLMSCVDGQPLSTTRTLSVDFAQAPPGVTDPNLRSRINDARVAGLSGKINAMIRQRAVVGGSGQLQALEVTAATAGLRDIYFWTDGAVNEPRRGFSIYTASDRETTAAIDRWRSKLKSLKGVTVTILAAGRGLPNATQVRRAHRLFQGVVEDNGGQLRWTQSLAQL